MTDLGKHPRRLIQIEAPSVTRHIARTLERYPDGGQILKVSLAIDVVNNIESCIINVITNLSIDISSHVQHYVVTTLYSLKPVVITCTTNCLRY